MRSGVTLHPTQDQCPSPALPHKVGTTPWWSEAVAYRNIAQCFKSSPTLAGTRDQTQITYRAHIYCSRLQAKAKMEINPEDGVTVGMVGWVMVVEGSVE